MSSRGVGGYNSIIPQGRQAHGNAALQAPVIMMGQNRADAKDRIRAELDYRVNVKAETEVAELHAKIDELRQDVMRSLDVAVRYQSTNDLS